MKIYEIKSPVVFTEGIVEPNALLSVRNVVERGKATNTFEFVVLTRLLQMLKCGTLSSESPIQSHMSTSKELIDLLRSMNPKDLTEIARMLLTMLETQELGSRNLCCPDMGYQEWINLYRSREATD